MKLSFQKIVPLIMASVFTALLLTSGFSASAAQPKRLASPNGEIALSLSIDEGLPFFSVSDQKGALIDRSPMGLSWDEKEAPLWKETGVQNVARDSFWKPVWGKRAKVRDNFNELTISLKPADDGDVAMDLIARAYNDGVAFRYRLSDAKGDENRSLTVHSDLTSIRFAGDYTAWSYNGERANKGPEKLTKAAGARRLPMTLKVGDGRYMAISEAALFNFSWLNLRTEAESTAYQLQMEASTVELPFETPWRVVMIAKAPGDLIDGDLLENLNPPCPIKDTSWIKPGVGFWDWRAWGYVTDDGFRYNLDMASWRRFIDFASETGVSYLMLDANWYGMERSPKANPMTSRDYMLKQVKLKMVAVPAPDDWKDPIDVPALIRYAKTKNVGVFLYINDVARKNWDFNKTLKTYKEWGAAGIKYGFMRESGRQNKINVTQSIVELCAKYELMCDFHDGPIPPAGRYRTWPNCLTTEFCHGQSDALRAFTPTTFCTAIYVNMTQGPLDMCNGLFNLEDSHKSRPRVIQEVPSTLAGEAARTLIVFSGFTMLPDAVEPYKQHPEVFKFISSQKMPWVETRVLSGEIEEHVVMMRQTRDAWLIGASTNDEARALEIKLDFLPTGGQFQAVIIEDGDDAHMLERQESVKVRKKAVRSGDTLTVKLVAGGGACVRIERASK